MKTALILLDLHPNFSADAETSCWSLPDAAPLNWLCPWSHNYMHHFCDYKQLFETAKCANVCKADKVKNILMYRWSELHWNWDGGLWSTNVFTVYFFHISLPVYPYVFLAHLSVVHWFIQPLSTRALIFSVFLFLLQRELPFFLTFFSLSFYLFHTRTLKTHRDTHTHARTHTRAHTHTDLFFLSQPLVVRSMPPPGRLSLSYSAAPCGRVKRQTSSILSQILCASQ